VPTLATTAVKDLLKKTSKEPPLLVVVISYYHGPVYQRLPTLLYHIAIIINYMHNICFKFLLFFIVFECSTLSELNKIVSVFKNTVAKMTDFLSQSFFLSW
jgi:hypothetical protein